MVIDDTFTANYDGTREASIYFEDNSDEVTIIDSDRNSVEDQSNIVKFTSEGGSETFGVEVDATATDSVSIDELNVASASK